MKVWCAICKKEVDEIYKEESLFNNKTTIHVKCHGDMDSCEFDPNIWLQYPDSRVTKIEAFRTKNLAP